VSKKFAFVKIPVTTWNYSSSETRDISGRVATAHTGPSNRFTWASNFILTDDEGDEILFSGMMIPEVIKLKAEKASELLIYRSNIKDKKAGLIIGAVVDGKLHLTPNYIDVVRAFHKSTSAGRSLLLPLVSVLVWFVAAFAALYLGGVMNGGWGVFFGVLISSTVALVALNKFVARLGIPRADLDKILMGYAGNMSSLATNNKY